MRVQLQLLALLAPFTLATPAAEFGYDPAPLKHEHPGQLFNHVNSKSKCLSGVLTDTNSTGKYESVGGSKWRLSRLGSKLTEGSQHLSRLPKIQED